MLCRYIQRWVNQDEPLLDLRADYGEFSRFTRASEKRAPDLNPDLIACWGGAVRPIIQPATSPLYSDDMPVVFGTRTSREFIWMGANMNLFLRWGNWAVAKMTELLFNTTILTDMGCTQRLISREAMDLIRPHLNIGGSHFGPQVLLEVVSHGIPFVEIPMNYRPRVGESSVTGCFWKAFRLGWRMIVLVLAYRFGFYRRRRTMWSQRPGTPSRILPDYSVKEAAQSLSALARAIEPDTGKSKVEAPRR